MLQGTTPASERGDGGGVGGQTVGNVGWRLAQEEFGDPAPGDVIRVVGWPSGANVAPSGFGSAGEVPSTSSGSGLSTMLFPHQDGAEALIHFPLVMLVLGWPTVSMPSRSVRRLGCV